MNKNNALMTFSDIDIGLQKCELNLAMLYSKGELEKFKKRWKEFILACMPHSDIISLVGDVLKYTTESLIPSKTDGRYPVLLLLGNPATHSIVDKMFFASEGNKPGNKREHRIWSALRETGFFDDKLSDDSLEDKNRKRKDKIYNLDYVSDFRIGMTVYYSFPSPASGDKWSGVSGIRKLFGDEALNLIAKEEQKRVSDIIENFINGKGAVIAFQKDVYEAMRSAETPKYSISCAKKGKLLGKCDCGQEVLLIGTPPTRFANSEVFKSILCGFKKSFLYERIL